MAGIVKRKISRSVMPVAVIVLIRNRALIIRELVFFIKERKSNMEECDK